MLQLFPIIQIYNSDQLGSFFCRFHPHLEKVSVRYLQVKQNRAENFKVSSPKSSTAREKRPRYKQESPGGVSRRRK